MSAEIHRLPADDAAGTGAGETSPAASGSVYLDAYLAPFRQWLERDTVTEIIVNRPSEVWIEDAAHPGMQRIEAPEIDDRLVQRLAEQVARVSHQGINREHPLLGATLPDGGRVQFCGPPATRKHWAMAIRRHRLLDLALDAYDAGPLAAPREHALPDPAVEPLFPSISVALVGGADAFSLRRPKNFSTTKIATSRTRPATTSLRH